MYSAYSFLLFSFASIIQKFALLNNFVIRIASLTIQQKWHLMDSISRKNWIISAVLLYNLKWKKFFGNGLWSNFGTWDLKSGKKIERTWFFVPIEFQLLWSEEANVISLYFSFARSLFIPRYWHDIWQVANKNCCIFHWFCLISKFVIFD